MPDITTTENDLSRLRLLHLVSPTLPIGAFTYSQGLEWAVECRWITTAEDLSQWVCNLLETSMTHLEIPLLRRLYQACAQSDIEALAYWSRYLIACRETRELRLEERHRGRALATLLPALGVPVSNDNLPLFKTCHLAGFAHAAQHWQIPLYNAAQGLLWAWLENITLAGVKIIPIGQTDGQKIIATLTSQIPQAVEIGLHVNDDAIGAACPAQTIASSLHETQYTRIFRS